MATYFEIMVQSDDTAYAAKACAEAFRQLDRLESELSRFVESSDIARCNRLARDASTTLGEDAFECLMLAAGVAVATEGAFDPAFRSQGKPGQDPAFTLDPSRHAITSHCERLTLDLGAVGKGFALDQMAATLREWEISSAGLNSGGSTLLGMGSNGWIAGMGEGGSRREVTLRDRALSGSGVAVKGQHILDPRTGVPAARTDRVWALAETAGLADALSTAFFVMENPSIEAFCREHPQAGCAFASAGGELTLLGSLR